MRANGLVSDNTTEIIFTLRKYSILLIIGLGGEMLAMGSIIIGMSALKIFRARLN